MFNRLLKSVLTGLSCMRMLNSKQKQIASLQQENQELRTEVAKRQEAINKTNAYWKGVVRKMTTSR